MTMAKIIEVSSRYEFGDCRDGFNHFGKLFINGSLVAESKCHYINRTWEVYNGQTARKCACWNWMESRKEDIKESIKERLGLKRATPKVKALLEEELKKDAEYKAVKKHYDNL